MSKPVQHKKARKGRIPLVGLDLPDETIRRDFLVQCQHDMCYIESLI